MKGLITVIVVAAIAFVSWPLGAAATVGSDSSGMLLARGGGGHDSGSGSHEGRHNEIEMERHDPHHGKAMEGHHGSEMEVPHRDGEVEIERGSGENGGVKVEQGRHGEDEIEVERHRGGDHL